jgi:uncharacterized protein (TIGR02453 family)
MRFRGFGADAIRFFEELGENNRREWWQANRRWYEDDVRAPLEYLLDDLQGEFGEAKVFRPNRDTRFSKDKSPYKTAAAAVVGNPYGTGHTLYIQVSADGLGLGGGIFHAASDQLTRLRAAIDDDRTGAEIERITAAIRERNGEISAHERLKTAPRGYPADHPRIELLRCKGLVGWYEHPPRAWLHTADARDRVAEAWRSFGPLNDWLATHVGPTTLETPSRR